MIQCVEMFKFKKFFQCKQACGIGSIYDASAKISKASKAPVAVAVIFKRFCHVNGDLGTFTTLTFVKLFV